MQEGKWWVITVAGLAILFSDARADSPANGWQLSFPFSLTAGAFYYNSGKGSGSHASVAATVEFQLSSLARPYSSAVFIDYRKSANRRFDDVVNVGGYFQYQHDNWDTTAYLFTHDTPFESHQWVYGGRVRYRLAERHKVGIEILGLVDDPGSSSLMFGYYGQISNKLSIKLVAGASIDSWRERTARTELVWQIN